MKKILLSTLLALTCCVFAQAQFYTEDFEAGLPADWMIEGGFTITDADAIASQYFTPGAHTQFVGTNDDALGNGGDASGRVTTGEIDLTMATDAIFLFFESYFVNGDYQGADETAKIYASTDAGATWDEIYNLEISGDWQEIGVDIGQFAGQTVWLQFEYADGGGWNWGWCIDDIRIEEPPARDASFEYINQEAFFTGGLVGAEIIPGGVIRNNGGETITSVDLNWSDGTNTVTETISGLNIGFGEIAPIESTTPFSIVDGTTSISLSISNVNGLGDDGNPANDDGGSFNVTSVTPQHNKGVLVEEATGTWCPWCPRGEVFLQGMINRYPGYFVGVAVHNQDPMVLAEYDDGLTSLPGFTGFPSVAFNRAQILDPSAIEAPFLDAMDIAPPAELEVGAAIDGANIDISVTAEFLDDVNEAHTFQVIISENGLTGTGNQWNQANNYAGGGVGPMGGYEFLPSSVPASMMVYDHVGRALLSGDFDGVDGSLPDVAEAGDVVGYVFPTYEIPAGFNMDNLYIIGTLLNADGEVVNVMEVSIDEAVANGIFVNSADEEFNHEMLTVYPNPFSGVTNVQLVLENTEEVSMFVYNSVGQLVAQRDYGQLSGAQILPFDGSQLSEGMYQFHIKVGDELATERVFLNK